jgi:hypothetical protein
MIMRTPRKIRIRGDELLSDILEAHKKWLNDDEGVSRAYLSRAYLSRAYLSGANGIYSFEPVGNSGRIGHAVISDDGVMFALGCHWGNLEDTITAIRAKYGADSLYEEQVRMAEKILLAQVAEKAV